MRMPALIAGIVASGTLLGACSTEPVPGPRAGDTYALVSIVADSQGHQLAGGPAGQGISSYVISLGQNQRYMETEVDSFPTGASSFRLQTTQQAGTYTIRNDSLLADMTERSVNGVPAPPPEGGWHIHAGFRIDGSRLIVSDYVFERQ